MKRRAFLAATAQGSLAATVAAAAWPQLLRAAFADEEPETAKDPKKDPKKLAEAAEAARRERLAILSDGYRRAQRAGKPLLVIVIPADPSQKWRRGEAFGNFINHGSAEQLYPLALCEVVCSGMDELRQLVPTAGFGEPWMVLVETDRVPATVRRLEAKLPEEDDKHPAFPRNRRDFAEQQRREEQEIDTRIAMLAKLVHDAVAANTAMLEQRSAQLKAALPADKLAALEPILSRYGSFSPQEADGAAALIALSATHADAATRAAMHALLKQSAEKRLRQHRVPGSHWARHSGCGTTIEEAEERGPMIACGMGHVPERSWRFLYFFSVSNPEG